MLWHKEVLAVVHHENGCLWVQICRNPDIHAVFVNCVGFNAAAGQLVLVHFQGPHGQEQRKREGDGGDRRKGYV